jgi:A/G-specific adenine glycosylase
VIIDQKKVEEIQEKILDFYNSNKRDLPWRHTQNPYYIHLSEIMLQQTQVSRVIEYYNKFTSIYPTLESMAQAPKPELLSNWQGLGYNNRILRLQKTAQIIQKEYKREYPQIQKELEKLPGIGSYTSGAILSFAFNQESKVVDTNIRRILIHEFNLDEEIKQKELEEIAQIITPKGKAREWNNALMDYGALELSAKKTKIKSKGKQSKFIGSTRWVRSQILKQLLEQQETQDGYKNGDEIEVSGINIEEVREKYVDYDLDSILEKMQKDDLIIIKENMIHIAN